MFKYNLSDCWYSHLRYWSDNALFPRDFGLHRNSVYKDNYLFLLSRNYNIDNQYVAVFSNGQIANKNYDTIFAEARDETNNLRDVINDRDIIIEVLEKHEIGYRCPFSGRRSYHFYLDFPTIPIPNFSATSRRLVSDLDIEDMLDMHTVGNVRGMARIPHTYNVKGGRFSVYSMTDDPDTLDFISVNNIISEPPVTELKPTNILKYLRPESEYETELLKESDVAFGGIFPDCVLNILTKLNMNRHANHQERLHLASYLYRLGFSVDEIVNTFKKASDFDEIKTRGYVVNLMAKNLRPYSCSRVQTEMGDICPIKKDNSYCNYIKNLIKQGV